MKNTQIHRHFIFQTKQATLSGPMPSLAERPTKYDFLRSYNLTYLAKEIETNH